MDQNRETAAPGGEQNGAASIATVKFWDTNYWAALSRSSDLLMKSLQVGRLRGIVSIVDFPDSTTKTQSGYLRLAQELLQRDILLAVSGRAAEELENTEMCGSESFGWADAGLSEFCHFIGIEPVIYAALENTSVLDFYRGLGDTLSAQSGDLPVAAITEYSPSSQIPAELVSLKKVYGTIFALEEDPIKTADLVDEHIHNKRLGLGWSDRCGTRFSPFS